MIARTFSYFYTFISGDRRSPAGTKRKQAKLKSTPPAKKNKLSVDVSQVHVDVSCDRSKGSVSTYRTVDMNLSGTRTASQLRSPIRIPEEEEKEGRYKQEVPQGLPLYNYAIK